MPDSAFKALPQQITVFGGNNNTLYLQGTNKANLKEKRKHFPSVAVLPMLKS